MSTSRLEFKDSAHLDTAFPASERIYIQGKLHPAIRVPLRQISTKDGASTRVYDTRGPWADPRQVCNVAAGTAGVACSNGSSIVAIRLPMTAAMSGPRITVISASSTPRKLRGGSGWSHFPG